MKGPTGDRIGRRPAGKGMVLVFGAARQKTITKLNHVFCLICLGILKPFSPVAEIYKALGKSHRNSHPFLFWKTTLQNSFKAKWCL